MFGGIGPTTKITLNKALIISWNGVWTASAPESKVHTDISRMQALKLRDLLILDLVDQKKHTL